MCPLQDMQALTRLKIIYHENSKLEKVEMTLLISDQWYFVTKKENNDKNVNSS
jgi:hypothetical protein